jgi:o-succinylbenzoate---CoA ligase
MFNVGQRGLTVLTSPRLAQHSELIRRELAGSNLQDHFVVLSSGTTAQTLKGFALSRQALLRNADAVNKHFSLTAQDVWGLSLPSYHIGGLSVLARAFVLGNRVVEFADWNPLEWEASLKKENVTITTVVPTQVYDIVKHKIQAPSGLRYLIVGGDFLSQALEEEALLLGWPVIRTFGMTEICSQLASATSPGEKYLTVLKPHQIQTDSEQRLRVKSECLFTLQFEIGESFSVRHAREFCDENGYFLTQDRVEAQAGTLKPLGRLDDRLKISGRLIDFLELKNQMEKALLSLGYFQKAELAVEDDERLGKKLILYYLSDIHDPHQLARSIAPVKIEEYRQVSSFQRTDLGKLKKHQ